MRKFKHVRYKFPWPLNICKHCTRKHYLCITTLLAFVRVWTVKVMSFHYSTETRNIFPEIQKLLIESWPTQDNNPSYHPHRLLDTASLLFCGNRWRFLKIQHFWGLEADHSPSHIMSTLKVNGAISPHLSTPSWLAHWQIFFTKLVVWLYRYFSCCWLSQHKDTLPINLQQISCCGSQIQWKFYHMWIISDPASSYIHV